LCKARAALAIIPVPPGPGVIDRAICTAGRIVVLVISRREFVPVVSLESVEGKVTGEASDCELIPSARISYRERRIRDLIVGTI